MKSLPDLRLSNAQQQRRAVTRALQEVQGVADVMERMVKEIPWPSAQNAARQLCAAMRQAHNVLSTFIAAQDDLSPLHISDVDCNLCADKLKNHGDMSAACPKETT